MTQRNLPNYLLASRQNPDNPLFPRMSVLYGLSAGTMCVSGLTMPSYMTEVINTTTAITVSIQQTVTGGTLLYDYFTGSTGVTTFITNMVAAGTFDFSSTGIKTPRISGDTNDSIMVGGAMSTNSMPSSSQSALIGGTANLLSGGSGNALIVGSTSTLTGSSDSSLVGGILNTLADSLRSSIIAGGSNYFLSSLNGAILAGSGNIISGGTANTIIGGTNNVLSSANNTAIIACTGVTASTSSSVYVPNLRVQGKIYSGGTDISLLFASASITGGVSPPVNFADSQTPLGVINGINVTFNTTNTYVVGSIHVYLNGVRQAPAGVDYTEGGGTLFTMTTAPLPGDTLLVDYRY